MLNLAMTTGMLLSSIAFSSFQWKNMYHESFKNPHVHKKLNFLWEYVRSLYEVLRTALDRVINFISLPFYIFLMGWC